VKYGRKKNDKKVVANRLAAWGFLAFCFTALAQQPAIQSVMNRQIGILEQRFVPAAGAMPADLICIPSGSPITVDGKASVNEWGDSKFAVLPVARNWTVRVRFKHDAKNLYFAFEGVKRGTEQLFPEILIDPQNRKSDGWEQGEWWLHVSYNLCEGNGAPNVYTKNGVFQCSHTKPGWAANNPPRPDTNVVEVRVSFAKLGLNARTGARLGIAFNVTNATGDENQRWFFWPRGARLESPKSWGVAVLE
jgi:hypothetical protein